MPVVTGPIDAQGTTFWVGATALSPTTWIQVKGVTGIRDLRSGAGAEIDVTTLSSTAKEFRLGLKDEGSMSLDITNTPQDAGQIRLSALRTSRATGDFKIEVPTGSPQYRLVFHGIVTTFPITFAVDDVLRSTVSIRVTGTIVETGG
jgi:hypothetical protein